VTGDPCGPIATIQPESDSEFQDVYLIRTGNCPTNTKVINAQTSGASLVLVVNTQGVSDNQLSFNSYDETSLKITIPALILTKDTADRLAAMSTSGKALILKLQVPIPKENEVQLEVFMRLNDVGIAQLLRDFEPYLEQFDNDLNLRFSFFKATVADTITPQIQTQLNCLESPDRVNMLLVYLKECPVRDLPCLDQQIVQLPKSVLRTYQQCITGEENRNFRYNNQIPVENELTKPFILINRMYFTGSFGAQALFNAACGGFAVSPGACLFVNNQYKLNTRYQTVKRDRRQNTLLTLAISVVVLLILLLLAGVALMSIFRRIYRNVLKETVSQVVKESIRNYESLNVVDKGTNDSTMTSAPNLE